MEQGHTITEAASISGLSRTHLSILANSAQEFMDAVRVGAESVSNIALSKAVQIVLDDDHPDQSKMIPVLLKHERSGGYGAERMEHILLPASVDPLDVDQ